MSTIRLSPNGKVILRKLREPRIRKEDLHKRPDIGRRLLRRANLEISMGEADTDWLVYVQHVRVIVPGEGIQRHGGAVVCDSAGAVFLEQTNHA